jgi:hypothetical protein
MDTVGTVAIDSSGQSVDPTRCRPSVSPQDAHTRAEHAVYTALWNLGGPAETEDPYRDVSIGYDKLAALARAFKGTIHRLTKTLTQKLAIEVVGVENSALRQGKTWRVYGAAEILRRRREAGYLWTVRDRSTVRLVQMTTLETSLSADDQSPPAAAENPVPPVSGARENQNPHGRRQGYSQTLRSMSCGRCSSKRRGDPLFSGVLDGLSPAPQHGRRRLARTTDR